MDAEGPEILDIGHPRRDSGWRQRLRIHAFSPPGCLVVLDSRIEPYSNRRGHKGWIVADDVDGDDEQAALLAGGVDFGYESDEPTMLVVNGRPRKPLPQDGIVRNAAVDVQGDQPMRVTCPASGKQSARRLLAFSQARRLHLGVGESGRHTRAGTLARGCQAGRSLIGGSQRWSAPAATWSRTRSQVGCRHATKQSIQASADEASAARTCNTGCAPRPADRPRSSSTLGR